MTLNSRVRTRKPAARQNRIRAAKTRCKKSLVYRDPKFGFTVKLPRWWKCYIAVKRTRRLRHAEYAVFFQFKYKGKIYDDALSLLVYKKTMQQWREEGYADSPIRLLAEQRGRIFAYTVPGELPEEFLNSSGEGYNYKKYGRPIRLLQRMVNTDDPKIAQSFRLRRRSTR